MSNVKSKNDEQHEISIRDLPAQKDWGGGCKAVYVDEVMWGFTTKDSHAGRYSFRQVPGEMTICRARHPRSKDIYPVEIGCNERANKSVEPLAERIAAVAQTLISEGLLRNPQIVEAEIRARAEKEANRDAAREAKRIAEFDARAAEALKPFDLDQDSGAVKAVREAMEWAQMR